MTSAVPFASFPALASRPPNPVCSVKSNLACPLSSQGWRTTTVALAFASDCSKDVGSGRRVLDSTMEKDEEKGREGPRGRGVKGAVREQTACECSSDQEATGRRAEQRDASKTAEVSLRSTGERE